MTSAPQAPVGLRAPTLPRRLACMLYEGVLLFGVVMVAGFIYATLTKQRHALTGTSGLQAFIFLVLGAYFIGFWSRNGQTLAMQTWQLRLVTRAGHRISPSRALCRYLLAWLWFIPALVVVYLSGMKGSAATFSALAAGMLAYAALTWLRPDRQYLHDAICGTRLITLRPAPTTLVS